MSAALTAEERVREVAERLRERARQLPACEAIDPDPSPTPAPTRDRPTGTKLEREAPAPHWQEVAEERSQEARARLSLEMGEVAARETACQRLRVLLATGRWYSALELVEAGGLRYGARLLEIRRGLDGGPLLDIEGERRPHGRRFLWCFRAAPAQGRILGDMPLLRWGSTP